MDSVKLCYVVCYLVYLFSSKMYNCFNNTVTRQQVNPKEIVDDTIKIIAANKMPFVLVCKENTSRNTSASSVVILRAITANGKRVSHRRRVYESNRNRLF